MMDYKILINGEWLKGKRRLEVRNPYNQELLGTVPEATKEQIDQAISSALKAFKITKELSAYKRSQVLEKTRDGIKARKEELARTISQESGKPIKLSRGEVERAIETFTFASQEARQIGGETIPMDAAAKGEGRIAFTIREPIGVVGAITPFNFPLNLVAHKVAPAIASGNTVVLKPSTYTPITSVKLGEIMLSAGLVPGALNVITGPGSSVGNRIIEDNRIVKITFTGSPSIGKRIIDKAGLRKITLELGSNSAVIIDKDINLEDTIERCVFGSFANAGQVCISIQRIYVHKDIYNLFLDKFVQVTKKQKTGDPLNETTDIGPMITEKEAERAKQWIDEAVEGGAEVLIGGNYKGTMFEPTVLTDTTPSMKVIAQEIFAPVVAIIPFKNWDEAINLVNESKYGLQAGVYTKDVAKAFYAAKKLEVGGVIINDIPTYRVDHMPYGGVKESGIGREGIKYAIQEMTEVKLVCFNLC